VAQASAVSDVNDLLTSVRQGSNIPIVLNDTNVSLSEILYDLDGDSSTGVNGQEAILIVGFIDFGDNWFNSGEDNSVTDIRDVSISSGSPEVQPDDVPVELTGWFAGVVLGTGTTPEPDSNTATQVYLGSIPNDTVIHIGSTDRTWHVSDSGAIFQMYADSANNYSTASVDGTFSSATDGTKVAELGFRGTPVSGGSGLSGSYAAGDEYYAIRFNNGYTPGAIPTNFYTSINTVWSLSGSAFEKFGANDTGNNFYAEGGLGSTGANSPWHIAGNASAKILLLPLPSGALAGFALLGLLGFGRQVRRRRKVA
jgi:hypothetical protein